MTKIIHCADLHLDSPMETHMTEEQASTRNTEIIHSFLRLTEYAAKTMSARSFWQEICLTESA